MLFSLVLTFTLHEPEARIIETIAFINFFFLRFPSRWFYKLHCVFKRYIISFGVWSVSDRCVPTLTSLHQ